MFKGEDIGIEVERSTIILPDLMVEKVPRRVEIKLPNVSVPDISAYQRYLPDEWNAELVAGTGSLDGAASMSAGALDFDLTLHADDAAIKLTENVFQSGFTLAIKAKGTADATTARVDVSGTFVELDDSRVLNKKGDASKPWQTRFAVTTGEADFILPEGQDAKTGEIGFWSLFQNKELKSMLSDVSGHVDGALKVSDLDWITYLFRKPFSLAIADAAEVKADLTVKDGRIVADSSLTMAPRQFTIGILDYIVEGSGGFDLRVAKADEKPDLRLVASLTGASLRLEDEKVAVVEDVTIDVNALAEGVSPKEGGATRTVEMNIPTATISDMTAYNTYLPKNAPFRILGGTAKLSAKLVMQEDSATGFMKMTTSRIDADMDGDRISGVIVLDIPDRRRIEQGQALRHRRLDAVDPGRPGHRQPRHRRLGREDRCRQGQRRLEAPDDAQSQRRLPDDGREPDPRGVRPEPEGEQVARPAARPQEHQRQDDHRDRAGQHDHPLRLPDQQHLRRRGEGHLRRQRPTGRLLRKDRQARRHPRHRQQEQEVLGHRRHREVRGLQGRRTGARDPRLRPGRTRGRRRRAPRRRRRQDRRSRRSRCSRSASNSGLLPRTRPGTGAAARFGISKPP